MCKVLSGSELPSEIYYWLREIRCIAMVGASPKPERPSYQVMAYLLSQGFRVLPVNPGQEKILEQRCYPNLLAIPADVPVDTVVIFRRSERVPLIVEEALFRGVKLIWMQEGVVHDEAASKAREAGLRVVMNFCLKKAHQLFCRDGL